MPELPEVEGYRRYLEGTVKGEKIQGVQTVNEGRMLKIPFEELKKQTLGQRIVDFSRIGKFLFIHLENGQIMLWHFGLTGEPIYYREEEDKPRFERIVFFLDNGSRLAFNCLRKFGRLDLLDDVEAYRKANKLGVDAMHIDKETFTSVLMKKKTMIKPALLQQNHFAGVGNWIADEMLFQVRMHPEKRCNVITEAEYHQLYDVMQEILQTAINLDAHYKEFPSHFMVERRWAKSTCPRCEEPLHRFVVGGRGTFICESCQPAERTA